MISVGDFIILAGGIAVIVLTLIDVFQSVIVPRFVGRRFRPSSYQWRALWRIWPPLAYRLFPDNEDRRDDFLATFAPLALVLMLVLWVTLLVLGYGMLLWATRTQIRPVPANFWEATYFAGSSFFTIGYGDLAGRTGVTRLISLMAGASGLGVVSITTAYLFAIFGTFQARESFVTTLGARSGSPPSGVGLLAISKLAGIEDDLPNVMREGQLWAATLMESHLAYPTIAYFRSSHDYESWVGTLGSLLDAATLLITTLKNGTGQARIMYNVGRHAVHDLSGIFRKTEEGDDPGISREEFDQACNRLRRAGYELRDADEAWTRFSVLRGTYAVQLVSLARFFAIPAVQWVGDRSLIETPHLRNQLSKKAITQFSPESIAHELLGTESGDQNP